MYTTGGDHDGDAVLHGGGADLDLVLVQVFTRERSGISVIYLFLIRSMTFRRWRFKAFRGCKPLARLNLSKSDHHSEAVIPTQLRNEKWTFPAEIELVDHIVPP